MLRVPSQVPSRRRGAFLAAGSPGATFFDIPSEEIKLASVALPSAAEMEHYASVVEELKDFIKNNGTKQPTLRTRKHKRTKSMTHTCF